MPALGSSLANAQLDHLCPYAGCLPAKRLLQLQLRVPGGHPHVLWGGYASVQGEVA